MVVARAGARAQAGAGGCQRAGWGAGGAGRRGRAGTGGRGWACRQPEEQEPHVVMWGEQETYKISRTNPEKSAPAEPIRL